MIAILQDYLWMLAWVFHGLDQLAQATVILLWVFCVLDEFAELVLYGLLPVHGDVLC